MKKPFVSEPNGREKGPSGREKGTVTSSRANNRSEHTVETIGEGIPETSGAGIETPSRVE